ncbi:MAG: MmgE/PrpD family protein [Burkholderiales bacterium]|nr:MmgE/PrpD family protein [Burkholderiales bacterium]
MTTTRYLADFASSRETALPAGVRRRAVRVLLDTLAVTLAGYREDAAQAVARALQPSQDSCSVSLPWTPERYRPDDACLLLGTAAHVLDYDDVSMIAVCHPSVPIFTALYVLAQQTALTGAQFIDAFAIGTEILIRSGEAMGFRHYDLGFHATATLGTLGATAACARTLNLSPVQTNHALAIAASMSSGVRENFGTMVKSLHVGIAAGSGLRAARLAQAGVEGADDVLNGRGWLHAFSGGQSEQWPKAVVLGTPYALDQPGFEQKRYPCCYMMHKMIQATLDLRLKHGLSLDGLEQALVVTPRGGTAALNHPWPTEGLAAKFSGPYAVVGSLADGRMTLASFEDEAIQRPAVQAALRRVDVREADGVALQGSDVGSAPVSVTLIYANGRRFERTITASPGSAADPLTDGDLLAKWRDCVGRGLPDMAAERIEPLFHAGMNLDDQPDAGAWLRTMR